MNEQNTCNQCSEHSGIAMQSINALKGIEEIKVSIQTLFNKLDKYGDNYLKVLERLAIVEYDFKNFKENIVERRGENRWRLTFMVALISSIPAVLTLVAIAVYWVTK